MAACIVCNQQTVPDDVQDIGDGAKLHDRLQKVLGETVPVGVVMCASCQFDLTQIEMYYALLTVFKKRYSETAKQRLQAHDGETSRNVFHETADCSSESLRTIFGAANLSDSSTHVPLPSNVMTKDGNPDNCTVVSSLEIIDISTVKEEVHVDTPPSVETSSTNTGEKLYENPKTIAFPIWHPVVGSKKRGRPYKNEKSNDISSPSLVGHPKKRGRPRKNEQTSPVLLDMSMASNKRGRPQKGEASNVRGLKKRGRPKKNKSSSSVVTGGSVVPAKKRGRPRKSESSNNSQSVGSMGSGDMIIDDSETETSMGGEFEMADLVQFKAEVDEPTLDPTSSENALEEEGESSVLKRKDGRQRKDEDASYDPVTGPAARRKQRRPKKVEQGPAAHHICPICNKEVLGSYRLSVHMKCHTDYRPHACTECGKAFKDKNGLRGHMKIHTGDRPFECPECGKVFQRRKDLDRHSFVHSNERPVPCDQCDEMFKSQEDLKRHIKYKHVQGRKFLCNICGMAMYTEGNLRRHIISHSEAKLFTCQTCGKGFTSKQTLTNHEYSHKGEDAREKYLCSTCGKEFMHKYYLKLHVKIHTGESKHFCSICNKYFLKAALYKNHMRTHTDERPYRCFECGKAFRQPGVLRIHMMAHRDERPFKCACGQAFRQKAKLQRHMRTKVHAAFETNSASDQTSSAPFVPTSVIPPSLAAPYLIPHPLPVGPLMISLEEMQGPSGYGHLN